MPNPSMTPWQRIAGALWVRVDESGNVLIYLGAQHPNDAYYSDVIAVQRADTASFATWVTLNIPGGGT